MQLIQPIMKHPLLPSFGRARGGLERLWARSFFLTLTLILLTSVGAYSQYSTSGKDFWLTFGVTVGATLDNVSLQIRIVTIENTQATITFTETGEVVPLSLPANMVYTYELTDAQKEAAYSYRSLIDSKSVHIQTDEHVSVYAINMRGRVMDATGILPTGALDSSYCTITYGHSYGDFMIIALENNTPIYNEGIPEGYWDKGGVYLSLSSYSSTGVRHLTSNRPFVCFSYASMGSVSCGDVGGITHFYQQLYPESLWGRRFFVPVTIRGVERVHIIASQDNTIINLTGGTLIDGSLTLNAGEWAEIEIYAAQNGCYIEANNPVGVLSYLLLSDCPGLNYSLGNASVVWIPPVNQSIDEALVAPFLSAFLTEHHFLIVAPTPAKELTEMQQGAGDYTALTGGEWHDHPSGYSYYTLQSENSDAGYKFKNPEGLIILAYGLGDRASYYYLAGSATRPSDLYFAVNDIHYELVENEIFCNGNIEVDAVKFPMIHTSGHLRWLVNGVEQTAFTDSLHWTESLPAGEYTILMISKGKYGEVDSLTTSFVVGDRGETVINDTICQNDSYNKYGFSLPAHTSTGAFNYRIDSVTVLGCDSLIILNLMVYSTDTLIFETTIYVDEGYYEHGFTISPPYTTGMHSDTLFLRNRFDCDSLVVLNLEIRCREMETSLSAVICQNDFYFFKGEYLNVTGTYRDTIPVSGCDSIVILDLTVHPPDTLILPETTIYVDEGYYEHGFTISPSYTTGTRSDTLFLHNRFDCDSLVVLNLEIRCREMETSLSAAICQNDSYFFRGEYLNVPGIYRDTLLVYGCDSIVTLRLMVRPSYATAFSARIPVNEPYNAYGFSVPPLPEPGFYTFERRLNGIYGCDSVLMLHLTAYAEIIPDKYFLPDGRGVNDGWNIKNIEYFEVVSVEIYDRYGRLLVCYDGHFTPWDGTCQGQKMPSTDYWYVITLKERAKLYVGHFTLLR